MEVNTKTVKTYGSSRMVLVPEFQAGAEVVVVDAAIFRKLIEVNEK